MCGNGVHARHKVTTGQGHGLPVAEKLPARNFAPAESRFNGFKKGRAHGLRSATRADIKAAAFGYAGGFYNT